MKIKIFLIILILIVFLIFYITNEIFENYKRDGRDGRDGRDDIDIKVDVVYTWVESYDPEREKYQKMLLSSTDETKKNENLNPNRYIQYEELKYSIKSLKKYCPWVRNIYIVVKDGQKPNFINFSKNIILVNHSEIMAKTSLPTFNSMAIESCIHKIKGLSDYYIYMNDDLFINRSLRKDELFSKIYPHYPYINKKLYDKDNSKNMYNYSDYKDDYNDYNYGISFMISTNLANKITSQNFIANMSIHTPSFCYKPWEEEIESVLKNIPLKNSLQNSNRAVNETNLWNYTVHSKFRKNNNVALNSCFRSIYYKYKGAIDKDYKNIYISLDNENQCKEYKDKIIEKDTIFFCVNKIDEKCKDAFKIFIKKILV
jgi:hypothetical protein